MARRIVLLAESGTEGKREISGDRSVERGEVCDVAISDLDGPDPSFEGGDVGRPSVASEGGVMRPAPNDSFAETTPYRPRAL
jgi:hypothetical protein